MNEECLSVKSGYSIMTKEKAKIRPSDPELVFRLR